MELSYSVAALKYNESNGQEIYWNDDLKNVYEDDYELYTSHLKGDAYILSQYAPYVFEEPEKANDPIYLSDNFNFWAKNSYKFIGVRCGKYSTEKGFEVLRDWFGFWSGWVK